MDKVTTIQLDKSVVQQMQKLREYPRQTYNELLLSMIKVFRHAKKKKLEYDEFLHVVQQAKMQELWDNEDDEVWDDV